MKAAYSRKLDDAWKERLGLVNRCPPEFYESSDTVNDVAHAPAIRATFDDLGLSAILCVQGVPTVAIVEMELYDRARIVNLHGALWNQGLASLLLVIADDAIRAFSLARKPYQDAGDLFDERCLIDTFHCTAETLQFRNLIYGAESGRLWNDYAKYFRPKERIDQVLLDNLKESHTLLCKEYLSSDAAQALLIQAMFIAYLEDRGIITSDYFRAVSRQTASFLSLLATRDVELLDSLFTSLRADFNGDLFVAPCSFEWKRSAPKIRQEHLDLLARFRAGYEEMGKGGQQRFWGYDFRYIPIELVSAVYDRFLGEKDERRDQGAYYTPMFLADTVVSQVWDVLSAEIKEKGQFLDPACGSGVFLVRSFQRLCEHWRVTRRTRTIRWKSLLTILGRVHGWDINSGAVRVAVFSLYVALLEEVSPPDIRHLVGRGRLLPELWGKTLISRDFFTTPTDSTSFHVVIGNPPWTSRRGSNRTSVHWCKDNRLPMPGWEDAWAFAWKAVHHLADNGLVAFLLPAMGFLHNHAANAVAARNSFIRHNRIHRIVNFADLRFQLFEHAHRPAALVIYGKDIKQHPYRFDYWTPKADPNLRIKRLITLSSADKCSMSTATVEANPLALKQRLWMRDPDSKLFAYLSRLPKLADLVAEFGNIHRSNQDYRGRWVIGQGFKPFNGQDDHTTSEYVGKLPHLSIRGFRPLAQPTSGLLSWPSSQVHRKGFEAGFEGPRVLVPRGVATSQTRLRATYTEHDLTFQDIVQAITVPPSERERGKLLVALLNSRVAVWYAFHGTASFGSDRPEVKQAELLRLPFPQPHDLPDPAQSQRAAEELVAIVDSALRAANDTFLLNTNDYALFHTLDRFAYEYFCLSQKEVSLIEDAVEKIMPAVQPHVGNYPDLWKAPTESERQTYATTLAVSVGQWLRHESAVVARLEAYSADLGILRLSLDDRPALYSEDKGALFACVLSRISEHIHQPLCGNFQLIPDLRVFVDKNLYLIKPMQLRFWLQGTALADSNAIAMDLQDAVAVEQRRSFS